MTEIKVKIDQLKMSPSNVRSKHTAEDIAMMAHSIKQRGIINPLTVVKNGDGRYEVIAGLLRYQGAIEAKLEVVPCHDATGLTEAERIDISLSENKDRREMSAIQLFAAFHKLFKAGESVEKIGERYNKTQREVQRLLAIGSLPPKILELAENVEIGDKTVRALAMATPQDQARYLKLTPKERPADWKIMEWLAGKDGMYLQNHAIFNDELYTGPRMTDLFTKQDEVWLADGKMFWDLQNAEIKATVESLEKTGWKVTKVEYFQNYQYDKASKKDGGQVYYQVSERSGEVVFHKGYKPVKAAGATPKAKKEKKKEKPEISQTFDKYLGELRHHAVANHMINNKSAGLAATLALLITQSDNISFGNASCYIKGAMLESADNCADMKAVKAAFLEMLAELEINPDSQRTIIDIAKLVTKLNQYTTTQLTNWIVLVVARKWAASSSHNTDAIGKALQVTTKNWQDDDAFWNGINNKATLIKIAKENGLSFPADTKTAKIRDTLKRTVKKDWRPSWLKF